LILVLRPKQTSQHFTEFIRRLDGNLGAIRSRPMRKKDMAVDTMTETTPVPSEICK